MKKELFALFLLIVIIGFSVFNSFFIGELTSKAEELIRSAADDPKNGMGYVSAAEEVLSAHTAYLGAVLRHSELDAINENIFELKKSLIIGDSTQVRLAAEHAIQRLNAIAEMEKLRIENVF